MSKKSITTANAQLSDLIDPALVGAANDAATASLIAQLQSQLAAANAAAATAKAAADFNAAKLRQQDLESACFNQVVGLYGSNVTSRPGQGGLDLFVASSVSQLAANLRSALANSDDFGGPIAFIPVVLYPTPKRDAQKPNQSFNDRDGNPLANYQMGRTIVNDSYASVSVIDPSTGKPRQISLGGMCTISAKMDTQTGDFADPCKLADRIDKLVERESRSSNAHPEDNINVPAFIGYNEAAGTINRWRAELGPRHLSQQSPATSL